MALKQLRGFLNFDLLGFVREKMMMVKSTAPMKVYNNGTCVGTKGSRVEAVIILDKTKYPDPDPNQSNSFATFSIKFPDVDIDTLRENLHIGDKFKLVGCTKAIVYGDYQNELSISAELSDIKKVVDKK